MKDKQVFYGHGKLLLSGEYFVMNGAKALAIPTTYGQSLHVQYSPSFNPELHWKSYDMYGKTWLEARFEFWHFDCLDPNPSPQVLELQQILRQVRRLNTHFLRDQGNVYVETHLDFPLNWGLGSSSTLIYNISQWAYVSPFELLFSTIGGSGYDIACAQSFGPILYEKKPPGPFWSLIEFDPPFKDHIYFIFLREKASTREAIDDYHKRSSFPDETITTISEISKEMVRAKTIEEFNKLIREHENLISFSLDIPPVKQQRFSDFPGEIKSLGAWGGDFIMATSDWGSVQTRQYFKKKGYDTLIPYEEMIFSYNKSSG